MDSSPVRGAEKSPLDADQIAQGQAVETVPVRRFVVPPVEIELDAPLALAQIGEQRTPHGSAPPNPPAGAHWPFEGRPTPFALEGRRDNGFDPLASGGGRRIGLQALVEPGLAAFEPLLVKSVLVVFHGQSILSR